MGNETFYGDGQRNTHKYGHGETRNKKLIKRRMAVLQSFISPWKKEGEKKKKKSKLLQHGELEFGHPSEY